MAERSYFFNSNSAIGDIRQYNASDWSKVLSKFLESGIYNEGSSLAVTASGATLSVNLGTGTAFIDGYMYENDSPLTLTVQPADATQNRLDLVVLRLDLNENNRYIKAFVKTGTAGSANPPTLTDTAFVKEIALAQISVLAGSSVINSGQITDKRPQDFVDPFVDGQRISDLERDFADLPNKYASKTQEAWSPIVLQNGWTSLNSTTYPNSYYRNNVGDVKCRGMIKGGGADTVAFTLPVGYRPSSDEFKVLHADNGSGMVLGRAVVKTNGQVLVIGGANYVSLSSIVFRAEV